MKKIIFCVLFISGFIITTLYAYDINLVPEGTYLGAEEPQMSSGGAYVGGESHFAPDGTYVAGEPQPVPEGSYVGGIPTLAPDGTYVDDESREYNNRFD